MIELKLYDNEVKEMTSMIVSFWKCHNGIVPEGDDGMDDLKAWTAEGHKLYFIVKEEKKVGFVHLGSRGVNPDWLEDIFVLPEYQNQGIGSTAIRLTEEIVKQYSGAFFIEAASRNLDAIRLYRKLGFDCLNTITVCKDLKKYQYDVIKEEKICGCDFEIRKYKL